MNRKELLEKIDTLEEKLKKYESRLRDLIAAYKGLQTEKSALEDTVRALTSRSTTNSKAKSQNSNNEDSNSEVSVSEGEVEEDELTTLHNKINTLSLTIATLGSEKNKMEANFQSDRKALRLKYDEEISNLQRELESSSIIRRDITNQMAELKTKLREFKSDMDRQEIEHNERLKELQTLFNSERDAKERLEAEHDDMSTRLAISESTLARKKQDLVSLKDRLTAQSDDSVSRDEVIRLEGELVRVSAELSEMRAACGQELSDLTAVMVFERGRADQAVDQQARDSVQHESRLSEMEQRLSELSETLGNYERMRQSDKETIEKLRERLAHIDRDSSLEAEVSGKGVETRAELDSCDGNRDENTILELSDCGVLGSDTKALTATVENPCNQSDLEKVLYGAARPDAHDLCQENYNRLKEDFERYKLRAQSVLRNKSTVKESGSLREGEHMHQQIVQLKQRIRDLQEENLYNETSNRRSTETLKKTIENMENQHRGDTLARQREHDAQLAELQAEVQRHRNRTIALLAEKDDEIQHLRFTQSKFDPLQEGGAASEHHNQLLWDVGASSSGYGSGQMSTGRVDGCNLLLCVEQKSRKDVEIRSLRNQKRVLENTNRELLCKGADSEGSWNVDRQHLLEQVEKLQTQRLALVTPAPLEYLKNVFLRYLVTPETGNKASMLKAILTVLQFSSSELKQVKKHHLLA